MDRERKEEEGSVYFTMLCYYGPTKRLQIGKGVCQGYILSPCLFNWNEALDGIKIAGRNINNLSTTLMA